MILKKKLFLALEAVCICLIVARSACSQTVQHPWRWLKRAIESEEVRLSRAHGTERGKEQDRVRRSIELKVFSNVVCLVQKSNIVFKLF